MVKSGILVSCFFLCVFVNTVLAEKNKTLEECEQEYTDCMTDAQEELDKANDEWLDAIARAEAEYDSCIGAGVNKSICEKSKKAKLKAAYETWSDKIRGPINQIYGGCDREKRICINEN